MTDRPPLASPLSRLFELAARSLHSAGHSHGLFPAQWTTLRYLADAPASARTSSALARFQQMAIGPVTRTVRTLIAKGFVAKAGAGAHHRSELLEITSQGRDLLALDPLARLDDVFARLSVDEQEALAELFGRVVVALNSPDSAELDDGLLPPPTDR